MIIEAGKSYRRADGSVHGPARLAPFGSGQGNAAFPWIVGATNYTEQGRFYRDQDSPFDLVVEDSDTLSALIDEHKLHFVDALPDQSSGRQDAVDHPAHYNSHPSGIEAIQIVEHMNFCRGNAVKYIWRAGEKGNEIEDLKKARWYLDREIARMTNSA